MKKLNLDKTHNIHNYSRQVIGVRVVGIPRGEQYKQQVSWQYMKIYIHIYKVEVSIKEITILACLGISYCIA